MALVDILNSTNKDKTKIAKPSIKMIKSFATGDLTISGSTMDFMMYLSPYIDLDGRVNIPLEQARFALNFQRSTFERAIREALVYGLLVKKGKYYYSRFHIHTDGSNHTREYIQVLKVFTSAAVRNLNLREKRLFYYIAVSSVIGTWHSVHIENLYRNKLKKNAGVDYFFSFKEVADALVTLISSGLIELGLTPFSNGKPNGSEILLKKDLTSKFDVDTEKKFIESEINSFFEYFDDKEKRKTRTSLKTSSERVIQMRIAPCHVHQLLLVDASKNEFIQIANENTIAWNKIESKDIEYSIGYKNELYNQVGSLGLQIYRKCLKRYLEEESANILYYAEKEKMADYLMDFYILPEIQSILADVAKQQQHLQMALIKNPTLPWEFVIEKNTYRVNQKDLASLLAYFEERASADHKVLLDADLFYKRVLRNDIQLNVELWDNHYKEVDTIFESSKIMFEREQEGYEPIQMNKNEWRNFMYENAKMGLLRQKKKFWLRLEEIRKPLLVPKEEAMFTEPDLTNVQSTTRTVKKVELYNWLEERE